MPAKDEATKPQGESWERDVISRLAFAALKEQRRTRRWGIFFKVLTFAYIGLILFYFSGQWAGEPITKGRHTALIEIQGMIADNMEASADNIISGLRAAYKDKNTAGIILRINSPGGSPVQAGYVYDEVNRLRDEHPDVPIYAVITDICASGGYYIAASADEIYADKASLVGSIGVLMDGFGFVDGMHKLGIERRLITAGDHKGFLDPFAPLQEADVKHVKGMLGEIHNQFIAMVKQGRGERLKDSPDLFSGLIWTGEKGVELGLVDGLGSASYVARELINQERIVDYTIRPNYLDRFAERIGMAMVNVLATRIQLK
ncbi:MAG: peptidase S49 [Gammaproteobacteria bacterium RBG_16_57_12]|nr:MAG: peptidase S49 [Gammaproteobacteria bacterium RBG_16_57_12]